MTIFQNGGQSFSNTCKGRSGEIDRKTWKRTTERASGQLEIRYCICCIKLIVKNPLLSGVRVYKLNDYCKIFKMRTSTWLETTVADFNDVYRGIVRITLPLHWLLFGMHNPLRDLEAGIKSKFLARKIYILVRPLLIEFRILVIRDLSTISDVLHAVQNSIRLNFFAKFCSLFNKMR